MALTADGTGIRLGDASGFVDGLQSIGQWIGDTFFGGSGETNDTNLQIARENIEYQKWANEQNIAFQTRENKITRQREDNAVQRASADMTAAGLSKTLAAGNPASAQSLSAPQVQAPNNSFQMQKNMAGLNMIDAIQNIAFKAKEAKRAKKLNDAQVANIEADTANKLITNEGLADRLINENTLTIAKTAQTNALTNLYKTQNYFEQLIGPKNVAKIDSEIDLNLAKYKESLASAKYSEEMTKKAVEDTKKVIQETDYYKNLSDELKAKVNYLVEQTAYEKLKLDSLNWDLGLAKKYGYPTGQYPSSLFGVLERKGKEGAIYDKNKADFALDRFSNVMHNYKDAMDEYGDFLDDTYTGGGILDALRGFFNFSPLSLLFN